MLRADLTFNDEKAVSVCGKPGYVLTWGKCGQNQVNRAWDGSPQLRRERKGRQGLLSLKGACCIWDVCHSIVAKVLFSELTSQHEVWLFVSLTGHSRKMFSPDYKKWHFLKVQVATTFPTSHCVLSRYLVMRFLSIYNLHVLKQD